MNVPDGIAPGEGRPPVGAYDATGLPQSTIGRGAVVGVTAMVVGTASKVCVPELPEHAPSASATPTVATATLAPRVNPLARITTCPLGPGGPGRTGPVRCSIG